MDTDPMIHSMWILLSTSDTSSKIPHLKMQMKRTIVQYLKVYLIKKSKNSH